MPIETFYSSDFPPSALRVNYMLKYKGVDLPYTDINMMNGEQRSADYAAINPAQTVPAIVLDDGTVLSQVIGMLSYIDEEYPERPLMGTNAKERAQVLGALQDILNGGLMAIAEVLRNGTAPGFENRALPGPLDIEQIPALIERGQKKLAFFYSSMNEVLATRETVLDCGLTQADIDLFIVCNFAAIIRQKLDAEAHPALAAHQARMAEILA